MPSSTNKNGDMPKATGSPGRKSVPHPNTRINPAKTRKMASLCANAWHLQCRGPPPHLVEKEPHLKKPVMVFYASSMSHHLRESDEQLSFSSPTSTSTPSKTDSGPHPKAVSNDSRCSMTPFETGLGGSFSIPSGTRICQGSITQQPLSPGHSMSPAADETRLNHCPLSPCKA